MDAPQTYLLKKIMNYDKNGLKSLGNLSGKHVDDIASVLKSYAEESIKEFSEAINKGSVNVNGTIYDIKKSKK